MKLSFSIAVLLVFVTFVATGQATPQLKFHDGVVHVTGFDRTSVKADIPDSRWREMLSVFTQEAFVKGINQPIAGKYALTDEGLSFEPTFPFAEGITYHVVFSHDEFLKGVDLKKELPPAADLELTFQIPTQHRPVTSIESIYPESEIVPENLLRMYIAFSGPMMPGEAYDHIKLMNAKGELVERVFLIVDQELWDATRTKLTILFDPGRIKRGLKSNLDLGPPLKAGQKYQLVIDSTWRDVNGNALRNSYKKAFSVTGPQRSKLTIHDLRITCPLEASREPLTVIFPRLMDHNLVSKFVSVESQSETVDGKFQLINDNTLEFIPAQPWQRGNYQLAISPLLEDIAGNNFKNAFDLDLSRDIRVTSTETIYRQFSIGESRSN